MIRKERLPHPAVLLVSDLDDDSGDVDRVSQAAIAYRRAGIPLHVVGLNAAPEDVAFIRRFVTGKGSFEQAALPSEQASRLARAASILPLVALAVLAALGARRLPAPGRAAALEGTRERLGGSSLGVGALVLGVVALALAHDIRSWQSGVDRGDAQFATQPAAARWQARHVAARRCPRSRCSRSATTSRCAAASRRSPSRWRRRQGFDDGRQKAQLRGLAELALSDASRRGSPAQASRAGNLLGILAATDESGSDASVSDRRAAETFEAAIRADPANEDAKYNLELVLRRIKVVGSREGAGGSSGDFGQSLAGAGAGLPGSGY